VIRRLGLGVIGWAVGLGAYATTLSPLLTQTARDVERAFARHAFALDPVTRQKRPAAQTSDLFPMYGATPRAGSGISWQLTPENQENSVLCLAQTVSDLSAWNQAILALNKSGFQPAMPSGCSALSSHPLGPSSYPATIAGRKVLDRRDVPSPTQVPVYPEVLGVDAAAVTRPGLQVSAVTGPGVVTIYNPYVEVSPGEGTWVGVNSATARTGFTVGHACTLIAPDTSCDIFVSYDANSGGYRVGQLILNFSNGEVANVGLVGTPD
jgi:hypothetical protein